MNLQALLSEDVPTKSYPKPSINTTPYHSTNGGLVTPKHSPSSEAKDIIFRLCDSSTPHTMDYRNLPTLSVTINPHDTTESIAFTVKSYFGLLSNPGLRVSFENMHGHCLILSHENMANGMEVLVKAVDDEYRQCYQEIPPPQYQDEYTQNLYRGPISAPSAPMARSRSYKRYGSDTTGSDIDGDSRLKPEPVASAEISLDNIVEGSRRKKAKFESSELPLFPEVARFTASSSSASPTRPTPQLTPYTQPTYQYPNRLQFPPQSAYLYNLGTEQSPPPILIPGGRAILPTPAPTIASCISDEDVAIQLMRLGEMPGQASNGLISPVSTRPYVEYSADEGTPERNLVHHNPPPAGLKIQPGINQKKRKEPTYDTTDGSDDGVDDDQDETYIGTLDADEDDEDDKPLIAKRSLAPVRRAPAPPNMPPRKKQNNQNKSKSTNGVRKAPSSKVKGPLMNANNITQFKLAPAPMLPPVPINHNFQNSGIYGVVPSAPSQPTPFIPNTFQPATEALSMPEPIDQTKPRCQRCRKSKKGCDRQRPCQRCKDAGIPADQCISEDEAGTRRGKANAAKAAGTKPKNGGVLKPKKRKLSIE